MHWNFLECLLPILDEFSRFHNAAWGTTREQGGTCAGIRNSETELPLHLLIIIKKKVSGKAFENQNNSLPFYFPCLRAHSLPFLSEATTGKNLMYSSSNHVCIHFFLLKIHIISLLCIFTNVHKRCHFTWNNVILQLNFDSTLCFCALVYTFLYLWC